MLISSGLTFTGGFAIAEPVSLPNPYTANYVIPYGYNSQFSSVNIQPNVTVQLLSAGTWGILPVSQIYTSNYTITSPSFTQAGPIRIIPSVTVEVDNGASWNVT